MNQDNNNTKNHEYHTYDGIIEHNNPMPMWWQWSFILCVIFAFIYYIHYELGGGPTLQDELKVALNEIKLAQTQSDQVAIAITDETIQQTMKDPEKLNAGATVFANKCAVCHGNQLEGKIGPNLTDNHWIIGNGTALSIGHTIEVGSPVKGMPPWKGVLTDKEILYVTSFVHSKHGSHPPQAKAPEGTKYE